MITKRTRRSIRTVAGALLVTMVLMTLALAAPVGASELQNAVEVWLSGEAGEELHFFQRVPVGASDLNIELMDGTGDAQIYVRLGARPTVTNYDCGGPSAALPGEPDREICGDAPPAPGTWYVMVRSFEDFFNARLEAFYTCVGDCETVRQLRNDVPVTGLSGQAGEKRYFSLAVPPGAQDLRFPFSCGTGDAGLYLKHGFPPTLSAYHPASPGHCALGGGGLIPYPLPGTWYFMVYAFDDISGVDVKTGYVCGEDCEAFVSSCETSTLALVDPGSVADEMSITSSQAAIDLDVVLDLTHSWVGDLELTLEHVDTGTTVTLADRPGGIGCSGSDISATVDDEASSAVEDQCAATAPAVNGIFTPSSPLSAFDGESLDGTWRLTVTDHANIDSGSLNWWCLNAETVPNGLIFSDGFESGDTWAWSATR